MTTYEGKEVWTRISTSDLGGDNGKMIIWINPDQDGAVQVNDKTAEVFISRFFEVVKDGGQGPAITSMKDGKLTIEAPYAHNESGGSEVDWAETTLDLKNVEIRIFESPEEWQEFAHNYPEIAKKVFSRSFNRSGSGVYLTPKEGGGTLLIELHATWNSLQNYWNGKEPLPLSVPEFRDVLESDGFYPSFWVALSVFAYRQEGKNAFIVASGTGQSQLDYPFSDVQGSFDIMPVGFMESLPRK
jgi:hypothetical protein